MNVKELIIKLLDMPLHADVGHVWDGELRTQINCVWETNSGAVATSDFNAVVYSQESRPIGAPTEEEDRYWRTENNYKDEE